MAINLWKLGGKPTSYNPLPLGWVNQIFNTPLGGLRIRFKACSPSNAVIKVGDAGNEDFVKQFSLPTKLTSYDYDFASRSYNQGFYFYDLNSKGDIIVQDIELVEKPLGKPFNVPVPKKNLFKGFNTWMPENSTRSIVINDLKIIHYPNIIASNNFAYVYLKPNTTYSVSFKATSPTPNNGTMAVYSKDASTIYNGSYRADSFTIKTGSDTQYRLYWRNDDALEEVIFENIQIEEGTTATPFEPYEVQLNEKPKVFVPKKNLINKNSIQLNMVLSGGNISVVQNRAVSDFISITPLKSYVRTINGDGNRQVAFYDGSKQFISQTAISLDGIFTVPSNAYFCRTSWDYTVLSTDDIQLEEGTTATPFEPYELDLPKSKRSLTSIRTLQAKR